MVSRLRHGFQLRIHIQPVSLHTKPNMLADIPIQRAQQFATNQPSRVAPSENKDVDDADSRAAAARFCSVSTR